MAAHERRTSNFSAFVLIGTIAFSCLCVIVTDGLSVDDDGVVLFEPLPSLGEFESDADAYKTDGMRPGLLGDMARGWVKVVQPNGLPFDVCTIKRIEFRGVNCSDAAGRQKEYQLIQQIMRNNVTSGRLWNDSYKAPYFNFKNATGYQHQMWYDDPESLNYRMKYAKDKKLRGVGMWHVDCLDYNNATMVEEMWTTFDTFLK